MNLGVIILFLFVVVAESKIYKICVSIQYVEQCRKMAGVETKSKVTIECIAARDRMDCLWYIQQRQADFMPVEPEDMYVAHALPNQDFIVFMELRNKEDIAEEFRYQAVMVVRFNNQANSLANFKGLKSCHTGVGRNAGFKIPLTMLHKLDNFPAMNDHSLSPRENELRALSNFFSRSCLVGKWSPDPNLNTVWKNRYNSLCTMCETPDKCDYPDEYSGYEGALRCLVYNGGDVAFTKVAYVRKFFGLAPNSTRAREADPDAYAYFCPNGGKVSVRNKPCSWAARPWPGIIAHNDVRATLNPLRIKIKQLAEIGTAPEHQDWFTNVLGMSEKINRVVDNLPMSPIDYLNKANYTEVIERGHGAPESVVRLCVVTNVELTKCRSLSVFAYSRDLRPRLDCVQGTSQEHCMEKVKDNGADLAYADGTAVISLMKKYNLHPVMHEVFGKAKMTPYAVAVVKRASGITDIKQLKGKRSCHSNFGTFEGLEAPVYALILKNVTDPKQCPRLRYLAHFFSGGSCIPGADKLENNPTGESVHDLLLHCVPDPFLNEPEECLKSDRGNVAFMNSVDLYTFDESEYALLCVNKQQPGIASLTEYATCNIAMSPARAWLANKDVISDESINHMPLSLMQLLENRPELFNVHGEYLKNENVIFTKESSGLVATQMKDYLKIKSVHDANNFCI